jgi:hypothetical protein
MTRSCTSASTVIANFGDGFPLGIRQVYYCSSRDARGGVAQFELRARRQSRWRDGGALPCAGRPPLAHGPTVQDRRVRTCTLRRHGVRARVVDDVR